MEGNNLLKMIKLKFPKNNIYRQMNRLRETLSQTWLGIQGGSVALARMGRFR